MPRYELDGQVAYLRVTLDAWLGAGISGIGTERLLYGWHAKVQASPSLLFPIDINED